MRSQPRVERDVAVEMRDGAALRADVYRPEQEGSYPVLLQRTPYNKRLMGASGLNAAGAVARGYVVVIQDVRGRYASDGEYRPYLDDALDGYDTVMWAASRPYSDGRVGMYGVSYMGTVQYLAASTRPEPLKAIAPSQAGASFFHGWAYEGGCFNLVNRLGWTLTMLEDMAERSGTELAQPVADAITALATLLEATSSPDLTHKGRARLEGDLASRMRALLSVRPLQNLPIPWDVADFMRAWMEHDRYDDYWEGMDALWSYDEVEVPALHIGGWYDLFINGTLQNYNELSRRARSRGRPEEQRLIVGPWTHGDFTQRLGDVDFGPEADRSYMRFTRLHLDWFDHWIKQDGPPVPQADPVRLFVMGENRWLTSASFPPPGVAEDTLYLHPGGASESSEGEGALSMEPPSAPGSDAYIYDPDDPVPSVGGAILGLGHSPGPRDQRDVEQRGDVLTYSSEPFSEGVWLAGSVRVVLWATSDAADTTFTAKLVHVHSDGFAQNLADSILRTTFRDSAVTPSLAPVMQPVRYVIELGSVCIFVPAGDSIRLEVSSSNFPRFAVNLNTGGSIHTEAVALSANQQVHYGGNQASHVVLTLVSRPPEFEDDV